MAVEGGMIAEYIRFIETNIVNTESAPVGPVRIEAEKYGHIPSGMAKHWIFANNLRARNMEELNQVKLVFYVLALRYLKKYRVRVEPVCGLGASDEMKQYLQENGDYIICLNDKILAMSSRYSLFYTDSQLLAAHEPHLGPYTRNLDTQDLFSKFNRAEKMLLKVWLLNVIESITDNEDLISLIHEIADELGITNTSLTTDGKEQYFGESIGCLPYSMDQTVMEYYQEMEISDVFLKGSKASNSGTKYLFLDKSVLGDGRETENLTILNHVKYFEIRNRYKDENEFRWLLSHDHKLKIPSNCQLVLESKKFFTQRIYTMDFPYERKMHISYDNLIVDDVLHFYPIQTSLLEIYDFTSIRKRTSIVPKNRDIEINFEWSLGPVNIISTIHYSGKNRVDLSKMDISLEFTPDYVVKGLEYYQIQYKTNSEKISVFPYSYIDRKDQWFASKNLVDIHFVLYLNDVCGFFKTNHEEIQQADTDRKMDVRLKFYPNKVIILCRDEAGNEEVASGDSLYRKTLHLMYYIIPGKGADIEPGSSFYQYVGNGIDRDDIEIYELEKTGKLDFVSRYYWSFNGDLLFMLTLEDIENLIRNLFIEFLALGYKKNNITWTVDYFNLLADVPGNLFEQNINELVCTASLLRNYDSKDAQQKYEMDYYAKYNLNYADIVSFCAPDHPAAPISPNANCMYLSDYVIYSKALDAKRKGTRINKIDGGLLSIFMLLYCCPKDFLELFRAESFEDKLQQLFQDSYQSLMIEEIKKYSFDLESPFYTKAQRELIYVFVLLIANAVLHYHSQYLKDSRDIVLVLDGDSLMMELLKKTGVFQELLFIISSIVSINLGINCMYMLDELMDPPALIGSGEREQLPNARGTADIAGISAGLFLQKLQWGFEDELLHSIRKQLDVSDFHRSTHNIRKYVLETERYYRSRCSLIKDRILTTLFVKHKDDDSHDLEFFPFIGEKRLVCIKSCTGLVHSRRIADFFDIIYWGEKFDKVSCHMLLPAVEEKGIVREKGLILYMDKMVYFKRPEVTERDFAKLNGEHAKTAADVTNLLLGHLEEIFSDENKRMGKKIEELDSVLKEKSQTLGDREDEIRRHAASIQEMDKVIKELKAAAEKDKSVLQCKNERIEEMSKVSFERILKDDFNKYMNFNDRVLNFYSKYKRNTVTMKNFDTDNNFKFSWALSGSKCVLLNINDANYTVLPEKSRFNEADYRQEVEKFYNIISDNHMQYNFELISLPVFIRKGKNNFSLKNKGDIKIRG